MIVAYDTGETEEVELDHGFRLPFERVGESAEEWGGGDG